MKPFKCYFDNCLKDFRTSGHLKDHLKSHYQIKLYTCKLCNASLSRKSNLKTHLLTHTGEKPYKCLECKKNFSNKSNYNSHYRRFHQN